MKTRADKVYPTLEAALERLLSASSILHGEGNVTESAARVMLERGARQVEGGWVYTRDRRLQVPSLYGLPGDFLLEFAAKIQCPHLLIKANSGPEYDCSDLNRAVLETYSRNPEYQYQAVQGMHHVHLSDPQVVAPHITTFLQRTAGL